MDTLPSATSCHVIQAGSRGVQAGGHMVQAGSHEGQAGSDQAADAEAAAVHHPPPSTAAPAISASSCSTASGVRPIHLVLAVSAPIEGGVCIVPERQGTTRGAVAYMLR